MKAMISQLMAGKTDEQIAETREMAKAKLEEMGYEVADAVFSFSDEQLEALEVQNTPLYYLASSLQAMSRCDCVYFCKGWEDARGCKIEHDAALAYGLEVIYGEQPDSLEKLSDDLKRSADDVSFCSYFGMGNSQTCDGCPASGHLKNCARSFLEDVARRVAALREAE